MPKIYKEKGLEGLFSSRLKASNKILERGGPEELYKIYTPVLFYLNPLPLWRPSQGRKSECGSRFTAATGRPMFKQKRIKAIIGSRIHCSWIRIHVNNVTELISTHLLKVEKIFAVEICYFFLGSDLKNIISYEKKLFVQLC